MGEPKHTMHQSKPIDAVRTLLQTAQVGLDAFAELSEAAVALLAEMERPLGLVNFLPFAGLTVDEAASQPAPPPMSRPRGAQPAVKTLVTPPPRPPVTPTSAALRPITAAAQTATTPVFTLPTQPAAQMAEAKKTPLANSQATAASTPGVQAGAPAVLSASVAFAPATAAPRRVPGDPSSADAAALLATMTMVDTLTDALLTAASFAAAEPTPLPGMNETARSLSTVPQLHQTGQGERLSPTVDHHGRPPLAANRPVGQAGPQVADSLAADHGQQGQSMVMSGAGVPDPGDALSTMALLATVTDALLTTAPGMDEPAALQATEHAVSSPAPPPTLSPTPEPHSAAWPATPREDRVQTPMTQGPGFMATPPVVGTLPAHGLSPLAEGKWPSATATPFGEPTAALSAPQSPDAWTLAQLINDVLAEEARRHGVDLS